MHACGEQLRHAEGIERCTEVLSKFKSLTYQFETNNIMLAFIKRLGIL